MHSAERRFKMKKVIADRFDVVPDDGTPVAAAISFDTFFFWKVAR